MCIKKVTSFFFCFVKRIRDFMFLSTTRMVHRFSKDHFMKYLFLLFSCLLVLRVLLTFLEKQKKKHAALVIYDLFPL